MQWLDRISRPRFGACKNVSRRKERLGVFLGTSKFARARTSQLVFVKYIYNEILW
jgi:hypothetical protein